MCKYVHVCYVPCKQDIFKIMRIEIFFPIKTPFFSTCLKGIPNHCFMMYQWKWQSWGKGTLNKHLQWILTPCLMFVLWQLSIPTPLFSFLASLLGKSIKSLTLPILCQWEIQATKIPICCLGTLTPDTPTEQNCSPSQSPLLSLIHHFQTSLGVSPPVRPRRPHLVSNKLFYTLLVDPWCHLFHYLN